LHPRSNRDAEGESGTGPVHGELYVAGSDGGVEAASRGDSNFGGRRASGESAPQRTGVTMNQSGRSYQSPHPEDPSDRSTQRNRIPLGNERTDRPEHNEDLVISTEDSRVLPSGGLGATRGAGPTGGSPLGI